MYLGCFGLSASAFLMVSPALHCKLALSPSVSCVCGEVVTLDCIIPPLLTCARLAGYEVNE